MKKYYIYCIHFLIIASIYSLAVYSRVQSVKYFEAQYDTELPFTIESALLFYYAEYYHKNGYYPENDSRVQYPEKINIKKHFSVGKGVVASWVYHILNIQIEYKEYIRLFIPSFFCLGIIFLYGCCYIISGSIFAAVTSSAIYGLSLPAFIRSTGMEFSRENFSIPFILFHLMILFYLLKKNNHRVKENVDSGRWTVDGGISKWFIISLSSLSSGIALATWDMTQVYLYILIPLIAYLLIYKKVFLFKMYLFWHLFIWILFGILNPYLSFHQFILSPLLLIYALLWVVSLYPTTNKNIPISILFMGIFLFILFKKDYAHVYSHMTQLLWSKIWFLGHKPLDPNYLSYDVRSLWVPALHSAFEYIGNIRHLKLFQISLPLSILVWFLLCFKMLRKKGSLLDLAVVYFSLIFFLLFMLFSRFEVLFIICICLLLGSIYQKGFFSTRFLTVMMRVIPIILMLFLTTELAQAFPKWGRNFDYQSLASLKKWCQKHMDSQDVVLSDFGLSASLYPDIDGKIVIHPKFESIDMRNKVKEFIDALFSNEMRFYNFCQKYGVSYFIYSIGMSYEKSLFSWPYLYGQFYAPESLIKNIEKKSNLLEYFVKVYDNNRYIVFKVIKSSGINKAYELAKEADRYYSSGDIFKAIAYYQQAVNEYPRFSKVHLKLARIYRSIAQDEDALFHTKKALEGIHLRRHNKLKEMNGSE